MASKSLEITFRAKDDGVLSSMKAQGAGADQLKAKYRELAAAKNKGDEGGGNVAASLRERFGRNSALGMTGQLLRGGGIALGVNLIAEAVGNAANKAKELHAQLQDGKIGAVGMAEGIVQSLPVLGNVYNAFHSVADLLSTFPGLADSWVGKMTGLSSLRYANQVKQQEEVRKVLLDNQAESLERQRDLYRQVGEQIAQANRRAATAYMAQGYGRDIAEARNGAADRTAAIEAKRQSAIEAAEKARKADADKLDADTNVTAAQRFEGRQQLQKQYRSQVRNIDKEYDALTLAERQAAAAEEGAVYMRHYTAVLQQQAEYTKARRDIDTSADSDRLKTLGFTLAAEYDAIARGAQDKKDVIEKALEEQLKQAPPEEQYRLRRGAADEKTAVDRQARKAKENANYTTAQQQHLAALQAQANAGNYLADQVAKRIQLQQQLNDSAKQLQTIINSDADAQTKAFAQADLARIKAASEGSTTKELADEQLAILQRQASAGNYLAGVQAQRLELTKQASEEEALLTRIIRDQTSTDQQRLAAQRQLVDLKGSVEATATKELADAELTVLQRHGAAGDVLAQAQAQRLEDARKTAQVEAGIVFVLGDQRATVQQRLDAERELRELKAAQAAEATKGVRDEHLALLQLQAEYAASFRDRRAAQQGLAAAQVEDDFKRQEAVTAGVLTNKASTAEQRKQAVDDLNAFAELSAREYDRKANPKSKYNNSFSLEENTGLLTGVSAAARTRHSPEEDTARNSKEANALLAQLLAQARQVATALNRPQVPQQQMSIF